MTNKPFNLLWLGFFLSSVGDWLYKLALPVIILQKTGSAYHAAVAFGVSFVPWIVFSLIGGQIADRWSKRSILIMGNVLAAFFATLLIVILKQSILNFGLLYITVFLLASIDPLIHPSFQSIIPTLIDGDDFIKANAKIQTVENLLSVIGPLFGGAIITTVGGFTGLLIDVISFVATAILLVGLPRKKGYHTEKTNFIEELKIGFLYTLKENVILSGSIMFFFTNFALNMFEANYIFYMTKQLGYSLLNTSVSMTIAGMGALIGGLLASKIISNRNAGEVLTSSTMCAGGLTLLLLMSQNFLFIGVVLGLINVFGTVNVVTYFSLRQRTVPQNLLGRVVAVTRMFSFAAIPLGSWFGGWLLAQNFEMALVIGIAGIIRFSAGFVMRFTALGQET